MVPVVVGEVPVLCAGDFGDGGAGGALVDDGFAGGVGGDEGLEGEAYLHADMHQKQEAIGKTAPPGSSQKRYQPPDPLLEFLENL